MNDALDVIRYAFATCAIDYWAEIRNVQECAKGLIVAFEVRGKDSSRATDEWVKIDQEKVLAAVDKLLRGTLDDSSFSIEPSPEIVKQFIGPEWHYDKMGVDYVIQVAAFGKLIFI